jgi:hypothetical protein
MGVSYQDFYPLACNLSEMNKNVRETLNNLGWNYHIISDNEFLANLGFSIGNWGEKVSITFNEKKLLIKSKSIGPQLLDYGKNKNNVLKFIRELNHTIKKNSLEEPVGTIPTNEISSSRSSGFIEKILNCFKLFDNNLLSKEEFTQRKNIYFRELKGSDLISQPEDFLISILPLRDKGIIDDSDLKSLKAILYD